MSCFIATLVVLFTGLLSGNAVAAWSTNPAVNNAVSTAASSQFNPTITSDGSGGAIITWQDDRGGTFDIYAQRISASGVVQWAADGVAISTAANNQERPTIISDGSGGAIITWQDDRGGAYDIYAQRINASGVVQWAADGVAISTAANNQFTPTITSDGSGGAIITWFDIRSGSDTDIYAQRINASGVVQWTADGVAISTAADFQREPNIISDGSGGAIITWYDYRVGNIPDIYAQRINTSGVVQWLANGVAISTAANHQFNPTITRDGSGGAIITWQDFRNGNFDIYAQRIDASGVVQWTADGVAISTAAVDQSSPTITSDGSGGAIITWQDGRGGATTDIYAQRINTSGVVQWAANGVAISTAANYQLNPTIISDGSGGAIITWFDIRSGSDSDIYAQRINASGVVQWTADGVAISTAINDQFVPTITSDGSGGAIITWMDLRIGQNWDIYAQRIDAAGLPVVEFYNTNLDHYFITADTNEAAGIDGGSAGPGWIRTGNSFKSGGSTAVCRFYGSQIPGPNSHFYTASASECDGLKQLQAITPGTQKRWNFESLDFISTPPTDGACPTGTVPVYRAYNNGFARGVDSNHRISSATAAIQDVVMRGWIDEGIVMCAPI
jgi:predicted lipoprotein with Yx(FWY)xxD motif